MSLSRLPALLTRIEHGTAAEDVPALRRLADAVPGHVTAHVALARACELDDRQESAYQSWKRAHLLMPRSPVVQAGLARTAPHARSSTVAASADEASADTASATASPGEDPAEAPSSQPSSQPPAQQQGDLKRPPGSFDDLDTLIADLEGARIEPDPNPTDAPAPDLESNVHDMVTPTLARIYERQKQYTEAARVYRRLADEAPAEAPEEANEYRRRAEEMEEKGASGE